MHSNKTFKENFFKHEYNLQSSLNKKALCNFVMNARQYPLEKNYSSEKAFTSFISNNSSNSVCVPGSTICFHSSMNNFKIQKTKDHENCTLLQAFAYAMLITGSMGFLPKRAIHNSKQQQPGKIIGIN